MKIRNRKGMSLITVLWVIVVLIGLISVVILMTQSDLLSSLNLFRRKRTIKIAESTSEIVISHLPKFRDLDTLSKTDTIISGTDTTYGTKIYFSNDSTDMGIISPVPLIISDVNPIFTNYSTYLSYTATGEIKKGKVTAKRTIEVIASFTLPGGGQTMGHTMYR